MRYERSEIVTVGFDDFAVLAPDPFDVPVRTGIRLPQLAGVRYRVLGASCQLDEGDAVTHLRQLVEIGWAQGNGDSGTNPPLYPWVQTVESPTWRFLDGNVCFTVTLEPNPPYRNIVGPWDQDTFHFDDADGSALLYRTAGFPAPPKPAPGYLSLTSYHPPPMRGTVVRTYRDLRNPWHRVNLEELRIPITKPTKVRVYIDVLQTNPATRHVPILTPSTNVFFTNALRKEDDALQLFPSALRYWAVGCALGIERRRTGEKRKADENEPGR